jgi:hypothetical protein
MPVTAGFKLVRGENFGRLGLRSDSTRWISNFPQWLYGDPNVHFGDDQSDFNGGATTGYKLDNYLGQMQSNFDPYRSFPVEVRFDAAHPQKAYRLRRFG